MNKDKVIKIYLYVQTQSGEKKIVSEFHYKLHKYPLVELNKT